MIFSTVFLETRFADGSEKSATGFFYFRRVHGTKGHEILVTNRHVTKDATKITIFFHERGPNGGPNLGEIGRVTVGPELWRYHHDENVDVAFVLMEALRRDLEAAGGVFLTNIDYQAVPTDEQLLEAFPIEEVTFVGYPNGVYDKKNYLPITRRGVTATPLYIDYEKTPTFLISASVFPGSSGSPVYLYNQGAYVTRTGNAVLGGLRCWFLGILTEFKYREAEGWLEFDDTPVPRAKVGSQEAIDIGIVFKERVIREAVDHHLVSGGITPDDLSRP